MEDRWSRGQLLVLLGISAVPLMIAGLASHQEKEKKRDTETLNLIVKQNLIRMYSSESGNNVDGTASQSQNTWTALGFEEPLVIAMVGLPARGKSYISKMLMRYLKWTGYECELFNVGSYRREMGFASADSNFFSASNQDAHKVREELAMAVQECMYKWLKSSDGNKRRVAIFDATNTTISRRLTLAQKARSEGVFLLFIESICDDPKVLAQNYALKLNNDDYKQMDHQKAIEDFKDRVKAYELVYEPIQDDEDEYHVSYIKLVNVGEKVITRNCTGYLPSQVALYLQNIHIQPRRIYLSLNAEVSSNGNGNGTNQNGLISGHPSPTSQTTVSNAERLSTAHQNISNERLAGYGDQGSSNSKLSEAGREYGVDLGRYLKVNYQMSGHARPKSAPLEGDLGSELMVLTGTSSVHTDTVSHLRMLFRCYNTPLLNELRGGDLQGMKPSEVKIHFPEEYESRQANKFNYRYPGIHGESYRDVIERLRPIIVELERQRYSVLIVCHLAVLRCIYAYFMDVKLEDVPNQMFEKHVLYELSPGPFGCASKKINPSDELPHM